ncbi:Tau-tubulin kinase 2 [Physocladia obscura]|uniref:Tau-tubulin kinase 2 n=1 Tax=Physocladia obscura TaxID=109957 RepID=A0AAD5SYT0_9FUNG|nr:Tau-tubulin kinase 2 [Physocladia obscura]
MNAAQIPQQQQQQQKTIPTLYNLMIKGRWRLLSVLGKGAFGEVYLAADMLTGNQVAVKIESPSCKKQVLKLEISIIRKLQDCSYVAGHVGAGRFTWPYQQATNQSLGTQPSIDTILSDSPIYSYMVMELLGPNLSELRRKSPSGRFSVATAAVLGRQMLRGIQALHEVGILHRDIKPGTVEAYCVYEIGNFCMSMPDLTNQSKQKCYLIDFGLSRRYLGIDGRVREPRSKVGFRGTARYASVNAHIGVELSRVDDLWSLFYLLVEFLVGTLPWKGKEKELIGEIKASHTNPSLVAGLPSCMLTFMTVLTQTRYEDCPRYDVIDECLRNLGNTVKSEAVWDEHGNAISVYDWEFEGFGEEDVDIAVMRDAGQIVALRVCGCGQQNDGNIGDEHVLENVEQARRRVGEILDNQEIFKLSDSDVAGARGEDDENAEAFGDTGVTSIANGTLADPLTSSTAASSSLNNNNSNGHMAGTFMSPHRRFSEQSVSSIPNTNYGSSPLGTSLPRWERQNSIGSIGIGVQQKSDLLAGRRASGTVSGLTLGIEKIGLAGGIIGGDDAMERTSPPPLPVRMDYDLESGGFGIFIVVG